MRRHRWILFVIGIIVLPCTASAATPVGLFETIEGAGTLVGWAVDADAVATSLDVHIYVDGAAGAGGKFLGMVKANVPRPDLPIPGNHGFRFSLPPMMRDNLSHVYYAYGIDTSLRGADNRVLGGSPRAARLRSTMIRIDNGTLRVGVEPRCGGTIAEIVVAGVNLVNNYDCTGRQVQVAVYDGNARYDDCAGCLGVWGWNPVQGGDVHDFGSPVLASAAGSGTIYTKTQPYEWFPDDKSGGPGRPVLSDVVIEQWISFVPSQPLAVRVHSRITHLGVDTHGLALQEFPAVYVNAGFDRFVSYDGTSPWTGGPVVSTTISEAHHYTPERWGAFVDDRGIGLTVYVPSQYPYVSGGQDDQAGAGPYASSYNYLRPFMPFAFRPGSVMEGDIYLIAGDYRVARAFVYGVNSSQAVHDVLPPVGWLETPDTGQSLTGRIAVTGWAFDNRSVARVEILVDGAVAGVATYGMARPDVVAVFPHATPGSGFFLALDTSRYVNGRHTVEARAVDASGNYAILPGKAVVTTSNTCSPGLCR
jgi:hypothetical protein